MGLELAPDDPWVSRGYGQARIEPGERPDEACVREAMEETGVACRPVRCLGTRTHPGTGREMSYWLCERVCLEPSVREPGKADRGGWFTPGEVGALAGGHLFAPVEEALAALADGMSPARA